MVATIEWLRLWPKAGALPQTWQILDTARVYPGRVRRLLYLAEPFVRSDKCRFCKLYWLRS